MFIGSIVWMITERNDLDGGDESLEMAGGGRAKETRERQEGVARREERMIEERVSRDGGL
jgi:hypothetical protein